MTLLADAGVDPLGLVVCDAMASQSILKHIRYFQQVDSTNSAAIRDVHEFQVSATPRLYLADCQSAGRGRHGRTWVADNGTLTFSLIVTVPITSLLSIAIGVAVARTIEFLAAPIAASLKWPNDVYVGGGKVAGILIETIATTDLAVIGVGLNVATKFDFAIGESQVPPRSLIEFTSRYPNRYQWLGELVSQLIQAIDESTSEPPKVVDEYRRRCFLTGQLIRYQIGDTWSESECSGIDSDGSLLVSGVSGPTRITSGEVQRVRPLIFGST